MRSLILLFALLWGMPVADPSPVSPGVLPRAQTPLPDSSLYQIASRWGSDQGPPIRLEKLRGHLRILTLFFGHCESSCPMTLAKLKALESRFPEEMGKRVGFVLVSLDPARDDAETLARFRDRSGLSRESWTLLRGKEEDTRELAMLLGVRYRKSESNGGVEHDAVIALLDRDGRVLKRYDGSAASDDLVRDLSGALQADSRETH
jgi:protein SCO1